MVQSKQIGRPIHFSHGIAHSQSIRRKPNIPELMQLTIRLRVIATWFWWISISCSLGVSIDRRLVAQERHPYQTPQAIVLASALQEEFRSTEGPIPLQDLMQQWSVAYSISVWLDRRIPTDSVISSRHAWTTVGQSIANSAEQLQADVAIVEGCVMIVPKGMAHHLESAYWSLSLSQIPRRWFRVQDTVLTWEDGVEARDVLRAFVATYPLQDFRPEQLEHDVWAGANRKRTSPVVVAIGLLANFDLQPIPFGTDVVVEPIEPASAPRLFTWEYRGEIHQLGKDRWEGWRNRWSDAEVNRTGSGTQVGWRIRAPAVAHRQLVESLAPPPSKKPVAPDRSNIRYSGKYRGELESILKSLAKQGNLELELPNLPQPVLRQELDLVFEQSTFEEILARVGASSGLQVQRDGNRLRVIMP